MPPKFENKFFNGLEKKGFGSYAFIKVFAALCLITINLARNDEIATSTVSPSGINHLQGDSVSLATVIFILALQHWLVSNGWRAE